MNPTRFKPRFCMSPDEGGASSAVAGAPATASADTNSNASASATAGTTAGDAAKASSDQSSASASVPAGVGSQADSTATAGDFRTGWDDTLKNDPSLKDVKTSADLAKMYLDTKKLVGQKLGIPGPDATPEAKAAFYEALGVPKDPAGYDFKVPDNIPEAMKEAYDEEHAKKWAGLFQKHGVPKEAAQALRNELFAEISEEVKSMQEAADVSDKQFAELAKSIYGDDAKASAALQSARTIIERHLPAPLKAALGQLSNTALLAVAAAISGETKALTGEDKTISREGGDAGGGQTKEQLRAEARRLQALPEYNSPFTAKGKEGHEEVVKNVKALYDRIGKMA